MLKVTDVPISKFPFENCMKDFGTVKYREYIKWIISYVYSSSNIVLRIFFLSKALFQK